MHAGIFIWDGVSDVYASEAAGLFMQIVYCILSMRW